MGEETSALATFLSDFSTFLTSLITWFGKLIEFVTTNPVLLVFVLIALAASVIAIVKRWLPGRV